ncbi:MAG: hypothetical protein CM15mP84_09440 [Cellvibrionales bacterium]|nr:MAG: hypothetical protein CM15mP84_09440 [Cellvibrionales bacterium]
MLEETAARAVWDHTLDIGLANTVRMTTQATEEYLSVGVTTASAGGMPSSLASFLGLMSRLNQLPLRWRSFRSLRKSGELVIGSSRSR